MSTYCEGCLLDGVAAKKGCTVGSPNARFLVVTDTPSETSVRDGRLLSKNARSMFGGMASTYDFVPGDFVFHPQVKCPYDPDVYSTKEKRSIQASCRGHMLDVIKRLKPEVILPLGAEAAKQVMGRAIKITKARGVMEHCSEHGTMVMPLLNPGFVAMYPQHIPVFKADIATLRRNVDNEYDTVAAGKALLGTYEIIDDLQFLIDAKPTRIAFDTENTGLRWFQKGRPLSEYVVGSRDKEFQPEAAILTMQFCIEPGVAYLLPWDHPEHPQTARAKARLRKQLVELLCTSGAEVVGQNLKYDVGYVLAKLGIRIPIAHDTLMLATLLDENAMQSNLDTLIKRYVADMAGYADSFNATYDKSRMWEVPLDDMVDYGCGDADSTFRLFDKIYPLVARDKALLTHYNRVSIPGLNTFASLESRGMYTDEKALNEFQDYMTESVASQKAALLAQVPRSIRRKHMREEGLSFSWKEFVLDILFYHKDGFRLKPQVFTATTAKLSPERRVPSTSSKDHLPYFFDECTWSMEYAQYVKDERLLNTSVRKFREKYIVDGMVRPQYSLTKTVTGRSSCVRADTPIDTLRGKVRADTVEVGDYAWTHKGRWKPVTKLFHKPETRMYSLYLTNGEVLTVTLYHRVMLHSGLWADVGYILERMGYAVSEQEAHAEPVIGAPGSYGVQTGASDGWGGGGQIPSQPCNGTGNDPCVYTGRGIQYAEGDEVPTVKARGEEPTVRETLGLRLRGWAGVPYAVGGGAEVLCPSHSNGGVPRAAPLSTARDSKHPPRRREPEEQRDSQSMPSDTGRAPSDTRQVSASGRGLAIEKVVCAGVHRVYDFEVEEDHSYLACGVFNHNSEDPNGQNYPKRGANAKAYRKIFVAPPGYFCIEADLSQAELRIAACMSRDPTMIRIYRDNGDIHRATALIVTGLTEREFDTLPKAEQKAARQKAKAVNFGFLYGMGWRKFIGYAKTQYGVEFTEGEAKRIRAGFFIKYGALTGWHEAMREFAKANKFVRSFSGRVRHLPMIDSEEESVQQEAGRQAINSPVQEFGSSLGVMSMGRMEAELDPRYIAIVGFVHDAIYCYVPKKYLAWGCAMIKHYMQTNPLHEWFGLNLQVPILADVSFGTNLGDVEEMEGFSLDPDEPYDWSQFWVKDEETGVYSGHQVPAQFTPPGGGRRTRSMYGDVREAAPTTEQPRILRIRRGS